MTERYLVAGLGNPGREYEHTRHNVGFMCADALVKAHGLVFDARKKSKARIAEGLIVGRRVLVAKPQTYMNLSGSAVQGLAAFYQIAPSHILVVYDDLDLPPGALRIRQKGGSGGHRGMADIIQRLGTQDFPRIRLGIGRPPGRMDPAAYVLQPFTAEEDSCVAQMLERAVRAIETWLSQDIESAMNRYNGLSAAPCSADESSNPAHSAGPTPPDQITRNG